MPRPDVDTVPVTGPKRAGSATTPPRSRGTAQGDRSWLRRLAPSLVTVALAAGCGPATMLDETLPDSTPPPPEDVGSCPPGEPDHEPRLLDDQLDPDYWHQVAWGEASALDELGAVSPDSPVDTATVRVRLQEPRSLYGDMPAEVTMLPDVAEAAAREAAHGATLVLRVGDYEGFEPFASLVVSIRDDHALVALGGCAYRLHTQPLDEWLALVLERDPGLGTPAGALRAYLAAPDPEAFALVEQVVHGPEVPGPPGWDDLAPHERQIDVEFTPPEVYERLEVVEVAIRLPEDWWTTDNHLCLRISIGWGSCAVLRGGMVGVGRDGVALRGYWLPGEPMDVWLLGGDADIHHPVARLQTIGAGLVAEGAATGGLLLTPDPAIADLAALVEAAERDGSVFTVEATDVWR